MYGAAKTFENSFHKEFDWGWLAGCGLLLLASLVVLAVIVWFVCAMKSKDK